MPGISFDLTDDQLSQAQEALTTQDADGNDVVPTQAEVGSWCLRHLRDKVLSFFLSQASTEAESTKRTDLTNAGW